MASSCKHGKLTFLFHKRPVFLRLAELPKKGAVLHGGIFGIVASVSGTTADTDAITKDIHYTT